MTALYSLLYVSPFGCRLAQTLCIVVARGPCSHILQGLWLGFRVEIGVWEAHVGHKYEPCTYMDPVGNSRDLACRSTADSLDVSSGILVCL